MTDRRHPPEKRRCFIGISITGQLKKQLAKECERLSQERAFHHFKWVPPGNFHLTLHFLGNIGRPEIESLQTVCGGQQLMDEPMTVEINGLSAFPSHNSRRYFVANINPGPALSGLYQKLSHQLDNLGFKLEARSFRPHITLARAMLKERGGRLPEVPYEATYTATHYTLFESVTHAPTPSYHPLGHYE